MASNLGPRAQRIYDDLRERITGDSLPAGSKLPSHTRLAEEFGVAPMTIRQVLVRLEGEGLIVIDHGRGTFVHHQQTPAVLIVDDSEPSRTILGSHVRRGGYRVVEASGPAPALAALEEDPTIALVLSDVRMPTTKEGVDFIRFVRRRWQSLPLAAVTGFPDDLADLHGTPECPVLILTKPCRLVQIEEVLRLTLGTRPAQRDLQPR